MKGRATGGPGGPRPHSARHAQDAQARIAPGLRSPHYLRLWCSGPANGKPIQRIAKRIDRRLNEVVPDSPRCLGLGGRYERARNLRGVIRFIEGDLLGLGIQHRLRKLRQPNPGYVQLCCVSIGFDGMLSMVMS